MSKLNYLNVGCGNKFHKDWTNIDMSSNSPYVKTHNLLKGIPFPDNNFDVIYHSQVLEHFQKDDAPNFIKECYRVLKPGGIMRIAVPDLENIVKEYIKHLHKNIDEPNKQSDANYDWIMLEIYDQTVRNDSGGQMAKFLKDPNLVNKDYIENRIGYIDKNDRKKYFTKSSNDRSITSIPQKILQKLNLICNNLQNLFTSRNAKIGSFRSSGEIHMWMYDRFSLSRLLTNCGFSNIEVKTPHDSDIPDWGKFELDVKDGMIFDPKSLFMEAMKS